MTGARPRGPRGGDADTRGEIVDAARVVFARDGMERGSFRAVAREAGVDPALVHHYFESKAALFLEALRPLSRADLARTPLASAPVDQLGAALVTALLGVWDAPERTRTLTVLLAAAANDPAVAAELRGVLGGEVLGPVLRAAGVDRIEERTAACATPLVGLAVVRYVLRVPPIADAPPEDLARLIGPQVQRYLTGPLDP